MRLYCLLMIVVFLHMHLLLSSFVLLLLVCCRCVPWCCKWDRFWRRRPHTGNRLRAIVSSYGLRNYVYTTHSLVLPARGRLPTAKHKKHHDQQQ